MRDRLFSLLGVESGEESMVSMLLTQSVFIGIFFGAFDISAHSLFLSIFDEKMMARGYVVSGIAGIILTSVYTWLQTKMRFKSFAILNLIIVTLLTLLLWVLLILFPVKWVVFAVFIMLGPLNILAMLGFWGTTGRLFTLRQGKRLFGLVDAGLIIGIIISCYTIPVILALNFESHNILLVSASSVFIATMVQVMIGSRFSLVSGKTDQKEVDKSEKKSFLRLFRDDSYIRMMGIFIALSVVTAFFVQYSFMAVTREQYPAEADMARFLGIFTGSMMIFTLLVKLLVFSYLIRNYGLRTCLAISPFLVAVLTVIAIAIGMLMGYTPEAASGFLIFFLLLALSRLFSKSLKDSIESPSFKVIYQTIDEKVRYEIQSGMDGTVNEIAALASGLILAGLGVLSFIRLIHFSWVLFVIIIIWIFVALRLYTEYRKSIRKALESGEQAPEEGSLKANPLLNGRFSGERAFKSDYFKIVSGDFSVLENSKNTWYLRKLIETTSRGSNVLLIPALNKLVKEKNIGEDLKGEILDLIGKLEMPPAKGKKEDEKVLYAKKVLSESRLPQTSEILRLLRDNAIESKRLAIFIIGKFQLTDMLPEVCECLNIQGLETDAESVLQSFGSEAREDLERFYMVSSGNMYTSKALLRLMGNISTDESLEFILSRLWSNSRQLKEFALECLLSYDLRPSEGERDRLNQYISAIIGLITWYISARISLSRNGDEYLMQVMNAELRRWNSFLFNLLSITYDTGSITKIRENLERDTVESVNYALEMIDIVIDESIKPKLIGLLDDVPDEEKLKNLFQFFPGVIPQYDRLLEDIINRDYNLLGIWTKACTLRSIPEIDGADMAESVVALLFSPETILLEESARLIGRSGKELYKTASQRLADPVRKRLDMIVQEQIDERDLLFEKNKFLSKCIKDIPEEELLKLAPGMIFYPDFKNPEKLLSSDCVICLVNNGSEENRAYAYYAGSEVKPANFVSNFGNTPNYILPLNALEDFIIKFPENASKIMKYIERSEE